jgi:hypothetical protein
MKWVNTNNDKNIKIIKDLKLELDHANLFNSVIYNFKMTDLEEEELDKNNENHDKWVSLQEDKIRQIENSIKGNS